ncbi:hypothetical protein DL96DRAFT_1683770 [Flagelloscypha sp. PMI_526]|nr:hypothetical protein DL96DRAFT_1683770 [Flagelloscypha sp. PMI_526]
MSDTTSPLDPVPIERVQVVKYVAVSSMALLAYDSLLVFDREIDLIWRNFFVAWKSRVLYLLARYVPMASVVCGMGYYVFNDPTPERCRIFDTLATWLTAIGVVVSEAILLARTFALFSGSRKLLYTLLALLLGLTIAALVAVHQFIASLKYGTHPSGAVYGCYPVEGSEIIFVAFMCILFFETIVLGLTIYRGKQHHYLNSTNTFIRQLYRDSLFFALCVFSLWPAIHSIISTRIVLNLREVLGNSSEVLSGGQTFSHDIVHSLRFAERELEMSVDGHAIEDGRRSRSVLELSPRNSGNKEQERLQAKEEIHAADFP